jgi:hypothetical protein
MKNFTGRPFFSLFFIARANQKIPNLALGRESIKLLDSRPLFEQLLCFYSSRIPPAFFYIDVRPTSRPAPVGPPSAVS